MSGKTCFVVQGFGKRTDFTDGRVLDLDASYAIIKEAVEAAGLVCVRADEIPHSGVIDRPMYEMLLQADLVIADLSTYNVNAAFELGIRYGLRPGATIIVAEAQFKNPFDVSHIVIHSYKHLGEDIGAQEAKRFRSALAQAIQAALSEAVPDSPVYTFLPDLRPPQRGAAPAATTRGGETRGSRLRALERAGEPPRERAGEHPGKFAGFAFALRPGGRGLGGDRAAGGRDTMLPPVSSRRSPLAADNSDKLPDSLPEWTTESMRESMRESAPTPERGVADETPALPPTTAKHWLDAALAELNPPAGRSGDAARAVALLRQVYAQRPNDAFVIQQLALATARSAQPSSEEALHAACHLLREVSPETTNDPETLLLWGAVHQQLWELRAQPDDLAQAVAAYERCFRLKQDCASGSRLAFLLDLQALESLKRGARDEAIADAVQARRVRHEIVRLAETSPPPADMDGAADADAESAADTGADGNADANRRFRTLAARWEAALGLGDLPAVERSEAELSALPVAAAMHDERRRQGDRLRAIQAEYARLLAA
ncbi:tetratricopeptide repeat-containing protein [Accumulibacter sp.]|uniref:tetratricopeptide repeat-containing protein n=1 Tax=Accumulibacter sp. TaxID=2053492 RepID=UPI00263A1F32|nr:tetratricopeptide repeat-containing protein [Accumulibacter sp.]